MMDSARKALAVAVVAILAGCLGAAPALAAGEKRITISPAAGTPDASPDTQISILGVNKKRIESVDLTGDVHGSTPGDAAALLARPRGELHPDPAVRRGRECRPGRADRGPAADPALV